MAEKKKDKDKGKPKDPAKKDTPPAYDPNAGRELSPYAKKVKNQLHELAKRSKPEDHLDKDSLLFNLSDEEREQVLSELGEHDRKFYRRYRDVWAKQGGDTTFQEQPGTGPHAREEGTFGDASDWASKFVDPAYTEGLKNFVKTQQDALTYGRKTPEGSVGWEQDPVTGKWTEVTTLSPEQQKLRDLEMQGETAAQGKAADMLGGYNFKQGSGFDRQKYEDAEYEALTRDITKRQQQDNVTFAQMMADKGIQPGTEQYDAEYANFKGAQNRELIDARDTARRSGGQEATESISRWAKENQVPLDIAGALYGIGKGSQTPEGFGAPNVQFPWHDTAADVVSIAGQQIQLDQNDKQFIAEYGLERWKAKKTYDLQNKPPSGGGGGGGGGGGSSGGISLSDLMSLTDPGTGQAPGYTPSQGESAVQQGVDTFVDAATGEITGAKSAKATVAPDTNGFFDPRRTARASTAPTYQGRVDFSGKGSGLFGGKKGLFG